MINNCVKILFYSFFFTLSFVKVTAQNIFYQDLFYGGVTGGGGNLVISSGNIEFEIYIEPNSTIKKAFLIFSADGTPEDINIGLNSNNLLLNSNTIITSNFLSLYNSPYPSSINCIDVSDIIDPLVSNYTIQLPAQNISTNEYYSCFYLVVIYENYSLTKTYVNIILNTSDVSENINYLTNDLCPINNSFDVGFALITKQFCNIVNDGTSVFVNGNNIGMIGGVDINNNSIPCSGVQGHFYYQNNTLNGLSDDIANSTMNETDAIANVQTYINNYQTEFPVDFIYQTPSWANGSKSNPIVATFLTYTTPCDTFSTTLTENINVCKGAQAQLNATGGIAYEWLPQVGLSCYNCPNPIVTADSINHYTCRIWNTDSCSKVLPVKINILPLPSMSTIVVDPTLCSGNTGHIEITNQPTPYTYTLDGGTPQTTLHFNNLSAGNHILQIATNNGCSIDTVLTVAEINNVVAQFTASPNSGDVPLSVNFTNQSANATNYSWYIENDTLTTPQANHTFDTSGVFTVTLVAYNNFPHCSDTATVNIVAEYPFTIITPSLYVSDENYTPYQIYTSGVTELHYELFTDQGKLVYNKVLLPTNGNISLWNSNQLAKGIYLYRIWAVGDDGVEKVITGKVVVI